jgi:dihydroneopterin aldolase
MSPSEKNAQDRILLEGMVFHGRHGTLPAERELGQPFVVDVELRLDLRPKRSLRG